MSSSKSTLVLFRFLWLLFKLLNGLASLHGGENFKISISSISKRIGPRSTSKLFLNIYTHVCIMYVIYIYIFKQLYLVLKASHWWTNNLSARHNNHQKVYSIMLSLIWHHLCMVHFHSFWSLKSHYFLKLAWPTALTWNQSDSWK